MEFVGICLITRDVRKLSEFYEKVLGVEAEGNETHMQLKTEGAEMAIFSKDGMESMAPGSMRDAGYGSITIMIKVRDVDAEYVRLKDMGADIIKLPETYPWGSRAFWFKDPDGNIVDFMSILDEKA